MNRPPALSTLPCCWPTWPTSNWRWTASANRLDNLLSNSLKYRGPNKDEEWVSLELRVLPAGYELRVSDNGVGLPPGDHAQVFELFYRAAPARAAGIGVGLAVVEQSGGTLTILSGEGQGTTIVFLPRYDVDDYLL